VKSKQTKIKAMEKIKMEKKGNNGGYLAKTHETS
jgi:hypothetical protein